MIKSLQNRSVNARGDANGRKESESRFIRSKVDRLIRNHTALTSSDHDDFVQECELHLFEYRDRFDPIRSSYQTFVNRILENKLKSLVRARVAQMRDFRRNAHSLNATICDADGDSVETARISRRNWRPDTTRASPHAVTRSKRDCASTRPRCSRHCPTTCVRWQNCSKK